MRIAHVMSWYMPNLGYQENFLPFEQKELGHEVHMIVSDRAPAFKGYERHVGKILGDRIVGKGNSEERGVKIHRLPIYMELNKGGFVLLRRLASTLDEIHPDVVHAHGAFVPSTLSTLAHSRSIGYRVVVDDHSHSNNFHLDTLWKRCYMIAVRGFYRLYGSRVSCWLPVTESAARVLRDQLGILQDRIQLLYLGADTTTFHRSADKRKEGRRDLGIDDDVHLIVTSGKFDRTKDIEVLLEAFERIAVLNQKVRLLLVGDGPECYMSGIRSRIQNSPHLSEKVILRDFVPNRLLSRYYNSADIGVWPGDHTITALEASATGLPCIVPESDEAYSSLLREGAALGFRRNDTDSLRNAISTLLSDESTRAELAKKAEDIMNNQLSWRKIAETSIDCYSSRQIPITSNGDS